MDFLTILLGGAALYAAKKIFIDKKENTIDKSALNLNRYSEAAPTKENDFKYRELNYLRKSVLAGNTYIPIKQREKIKSELEILKKIKPKLNFHDEEVRKKYTQLLDFYESFDEEINNSHIKFTKKQIKEFNFVFNRNEKQHTFLQSRAIISSEDNTLVIAGAGSGKTSTIIGKIHYCVTGPEKIDPKDILVISYTSAIREELKNKLKQFQGIDVHTMHSFGFKLLKKKTNELLRDEIEFSKFINKILDRLFRDKKFKKKIEKYFLSYLAPYKSKFDSDFKNLKDYVDYMSKAGIKRSLNGDLVASFEEFEIANFLKINGVKYKYEYEYKVKTSGLDENGKWRRQYKPDFYLTDYDIYLEHFAVNRKMQSPLWIDPGYVDDMKWKRKLHKSNNTKLIETYSYERMEGNLLEELGLKLQSEGVILVKQDADDLLKIFKEKNQIKKFTKIIKPFLIHFKSNELTFSQLNKRSVTKGFIDMFRFKAFVEIFQVIFDEYQKELGDDEIDFVDMLIKSRKLIPTLDKFNYKYIIIDEYQDISASSFRLIKQIKDHSSNSKLFAVGDDWQSIYKFLGSDLSYFNKFKEYLGDTDEVFLKETFRFHQSLANISSKFIRENKSQKSKEIFSKKQIKINKPIRIIMNTSSYRSIASNKIEKIARDLFNELNLKDLLKKEIDYFLEIKPDSSIFVLSRYNREDLSIKSFISKNYPNKNITYSTVHQSKGLEADFVILLNVKSGIYSFPSEIEDDPLLKLVNDEPTNEGIKDPEERRLFYVALTRAKLKVHIIADEFDKSSFIEELSGYENVKVIKDKDINIFYCNKCLSGKMLLMKNSKDNSLFFSCSNRPICENKINYSDEHHKQYLIDNKNSKNIDTMPTLN